MDRLQGFTELIVYGLMHEIYQRRVYSQHIKLFFRPIPAYVVHPRDGMRQGR